MEEKYPYIQEKMGTSFPGSPSFMDLLHFPMLCEIDGETHVFNI